MATLPGSADAIIDLRKLRDYALSPDHPTGRHKARVFRSALGLGPADADWLRGEILVAVGSSPAVERGADAAGSRWRVDI